MTTTQLSIETASRDPEALEKEGRFNLRQLAQALGIFETAEGKSAFMSLDNKQQAAEIARLLKEADKKKAGGGGGGTPVRTPSTKNAGGKGGAGKAGAGAAGAASSQNESASSSGSAGGEGGNATKLIAAIERLTAGFAELKESVDQNTAALAELQGVSAATNRFTTVAIGCSLKLAEEVMQASPAQVLQVVMEDMSVVEDSLRSLAPAEEGAGEGGGDDDEGN